MFDRNPLIADPPEEIPLENAPLVRVIAQVRFPRILSISQQNFVAPLQEEIREQYPILHQENIRELIVGPQGVEAVEPAVVWRFIDRDEHWRVSLTSEFAALETAHYSSRQDFLDRLRYLLFAVEKHIKPQVTERLGIRYITRLTGEEYIADLNQLVRSEVSGLFSTELSEFTPQSITDSLFQLPEEGGTIHCRWGCLPGNTAIDAGLEPVPELSWILDLDMFMPFKGSTDFNVDAIMDESSRFAKRLYTLFRWAVTDEFLRRFGGAV